MSRNFEVSGEPVKGIQQENDKSGLPFSERVCGHMLGTEQKPGKESSPTCWPRGCGS